MTDEERDRPKEEKHPEAAETPGGDQIPAAAEDDIEFVPGPPAEEEGPHEPAKGLKAKPAKKESEVHKLKREKEELREQFLRKAAEMENLKKRQEREKAEYFQYVLADVLKDLLQVLDNLERALETPGEENGKSFQDGVRMIHKQFLDVLRKQGVEPILDVIGRKFDPNLHHALVSEESEEVQEPRVVEELQRGYKLYDRLLRPSLVKVRLPKKS